jgi:hypothetical protein
MSCGTVNSKVDIDEKTWAAIQAPASCVNTSTITSKISPRLITLLQAYRNDVGVNLSVVVDLIQCFSPSQAYLNYLSDTRINPRPEDQTTFNDPTWRANNYAAWAASVKTLRDPVFAPLLMHVQRLNGTVRATGTTSQKVVVDLSLRDLAIILSKRQDILFASISNEFPESP